MELKRETKEEKVIRMGKRRKGPYIRENHDFYIYLVSLKIYWEPGLREAKTDGGLGSPRSGGGGEGGPDP